MEYNSVNINAPDSTTIKQQPDAFKNKEKKDSRQARLEAFRRSYSKKVKKACKYLGISRATFDRYVKDGIIPEGRRQQGFKELFYLKKDLDYAKHQIMDNCRSGNSNHRTNRNS